MLFLAFNSLTAGERLVTLAPAIGAVGVGVVLIIIHLLRRSARPYLLYLGLAFLLLAPSLLLPHAYQWTVQLLVLLLILMAFREAIRDTRARLARIREETREREQAFSEYLQATLGKDADRESVQGDTEHGQTRTFTDKHGHTEDTDG